MYNLNHITSVSEANKELAKLPKEIGGWLYLNGLTSATKNILRKKYFNIYEKIK